MFLLEFILMTIKNSYNSKILIMAGPFSIKWKVTITGEKNKTLLDFSWEQQWLKNFPKEHFWEQVTILRASLVAQRRSSFDPWVGNIPWRRDCQPTLVFLPGEFHGQRSLVLGATIELSLVLYRVIFSILYECTVLLFFFFCSSKT